MSMYLLSVKDTATGVFSLPHCSPHIAKALREFSDECRREAADNQLFRHPECFEYYKVGEFDEQTGTLSPVAPQLLARAVDFRPVAPV